MDSAVKSKAKGRSAKKTPPIVATVRPTGIVGSFLGEQRPLIVHLPIHPEVSTFDKTPAMMTYDPSVPEIPTPYEESSTEYAYLESISTTSEPTAPIVRTTVADTTTPPVKSRIPSHYSEKLMVQYQESNRLQQLPNKTEIACFWCCHAFDTPPCAIPTTIIDDIWHMYGNFCSPECATASLFKEKIDAHVQWERYALLNTLYGQDAEIPVRSPQGIRPAPPREVLRFFGGCMEIGEFRAILHERKLRVDVMAPPMVSIIQTMDTKPIDFYDQNLKNIFVKNDISHKYNAPGAQGLRLRRSKPVKTKEASVEWAMRITTIEK
jgi:hypothetical protein